VEEKSPSTQEKQNIMNIKVTPTEEEGSAAASNDDSTSVTLIIIPAVVIAVLAIAVIAFLVKLCRKNQQKLPTSTQHVAVAN
jgi:flagellar basal body-associated protein FliL